MQSEKILTWSQRFLLRIVQQGYVPKHVAYIMDGNRRYAKSRGLKTIQGHEKGYEKLLEILEWCMAGGIYAVTAYAFSIENFKRSKEEVEGLMKLFEDAMEKLYNDIDTLINRGVQFRMVGKLELFSPKLQKLVGLLTESTLSCKKHVLVLASPYTARDDMIYAIQQLMDGVGSGKIEPDDVSEGLMEQCLLTKDLPPVDMLVRTSGEMRFSDFMLWQGSYSYICFENVTWPEYSFLHFIGSILLYQRHATHLKPFVMRAKDTLEKEKDDTAKGRRIKAFLEYIEKKYVLYMKRLAKIEPPTSEEKSEDKTQARNYIKVVKSPPVPAN